MGYSDAGYGTSSAKTAVRSCWGKLPNQRNTKMRTPHGKEVCADESFVWTLVGQYHAWRITVPDTKGNKDQMLKYAVSWADIGDALTTYIGS